MKLEHGISKAISLNTMNRSLQHPLQSASSGFQTKNESEVLVVSIVGPTASGKSALAQSVALELDGEVVSADSMQIYRFMDIGTAKLKPEERLVKHHLLDIVDPGQSYSAQQFQDQARAAFRDITTRDKVPVLSGGTGFYVQAALEDMRFPEGEQDDNPLRAYYEDLQAQQGNKALWKVLNDKDPAAAALIHPNNFKRVIRALEMFEEGVSYADQVKNIKSLPEVVPSIRFFLKVDPLILAERINARVDMMREEGLVEEVEALMARGFEEALTAPKAIGYKEIIAYEQGRISLDEAFRQIKTATRRYAKRQRSWFRRDKRLIPLDADDLSADQMTEIICERYRHESSKLLVR